MPVSQIVELQKIRPDIVDFIVKETELEADFRRKKVGKINGYIALERVLGVLCALVLGLAGIVGGGYVAIKGHDWVGVTISTTTIGTLAVAFLKRKSPV